MNKIIFPLKQDASGTNVTDLQDALLQCLERGALLANDESARRQFSAVLESERTRQTYGGATTKLVGHFQEERRLQSSGEVDEPTAGALNSLLQEWGLLEKTKIPTFRIVTGSVRRGEAPLQGVAVRAQHHVEQSAIRLGDDITDEEGRYTIRYEFLPGVDAVNLCVTVIGEDGRRLRTSDVIRSIKAMEIVDLKVPDSLTRVDGRLLASNGAPVEGITLRFYRRAFGGGGAQLAEVVTGGNGAYDIDLEVEEDTASLEARAVVGDKEISLTMPGRRIAAGEQLELLVPVDRLPPAKVEFERLSADVRPQLQESSIASAQENDERRDLTLLHERTGWDARLIALAAAAEQLAEETPIDAQVAYGLVRAGLPTDPIQLVRISREGIGHALAKAVEAGIVSLTPEQIANAQEALDTFGRKERRKLAIDGTASSYGAMLTASGLSEQQLDNFDRLFCAHTGDADELWRKAKDAGLPDDQLKLTAQLGVLTLNSARLVQSLREEIGSTAHVGERLVGGKLYEPSAWEERLRTLSRNDERLLRAMIPPVYEAETETERLQAYTADLANSVRRSYPMQVMAQQVRAGELPMAGTNREAAADLATVLERAAGQDFALGQKPLHRFLSEHRAQLFDGLPEARAEVVTSDLKTLHRQYQITLSDKGLAALRQADLRSAYDVSAMPRQTFLAEHGDAFPNRAEANLTWRRAHQVSAVTLNLIATAKQLDAHRLLPSLAQPAQIVSNARTALVRQYPTMESLFGSLDFCECAHCRSVLSPAAYLVDLLKFLDDAPGKPKKPYAALIERRPDLPHLKLTCENTLTPLPYIDIVNEILEFYLVQDPHGLTPDAAYDTGDAVSADLIAEPQNVLPEAYELLKEARYPLTAPFDLWLATVRAFTDHFEVPFWQLLDALRPSDELFAADGNEYGLAAIAYARLGLSPAELRILTEPASLANWPELFGYPAGATAAALGELAGAKNLARKLGVSYHDLAALLRTRFVNPKQELVLVDPESADPCSWEQTRLQRRDGSEAAAVDLVLINTFVRVWRRLGWTVTELDQALVTFLPGDPDPRTTETLGPAMATALLGLSHLVHLIDMLGAGRAGRRTIPVLWAPLSDARYAELFLTGTAQTRKPEFEGTPGSYLTTPDVPLKEHLETVQAALQLTAEEVDQVLADAGLDPETTALTMETVSLLHRYGVLARLLKLSVRDLVVLKELSGLDSFTPLSNSPVTQLSEDHPHSQTIPFVEIVEALRASGLSPADLDYLVRHRFDPVGAYRSAAVPPLALVRALAAEIIRIRGEYAIPADPLTFTDDVLARALGLALEPDVAAAFLEAWTDPGAALPEEVFAAHLRRHVIPGVGEVGFLDDADLPVMFEVDSDDQVADAARRNRLANVLLPFVQKRLIRNAVIAAVTADLGGEPDLVEALLTNPNLVDDPEQDGQSLLDAYEAAGVRGLTITDGRVTGYLEVPTTGGYQFTTRCEAAGTQVEMRFDHLADPVLVATTTDDELAPAAQAELRAGVPYGFTLDYTPGAVVELWVRGQQIPNTPVTELLTYPREEVDALHRRHLLVAKVLRLAESLRLEEVELRYLLTHGNDFDGLDLGALPTSTNEGTPQEARDRFRQILRVVDYARLRVDLAADPESLVGVFRFARRTLPDGADPAAVGQDVLNEVAGRLAAITRRKPEQVLSAAALLGFTTEMDGGQMIAPGFTQERGLGRLWRVLSLATRLGVDAAVLGRWANPEPDHGIARDVRDTVKAKYSIEQWRQVAQPIFDTLRQQRRDALVAEVLQVTGYERMEQLFEHFLVDPGTEPVVHTSRLRLAISSVQTFIQRCLLNLETGVAPSSIHADRWEWMKRYRVWEANRKIFLWPENWLEPEFRDDKTHLFAELESSLLESDLGTEAVEAALHQYLTGLEEIARLDIRAIYKEERMSGDVLHVVARTTNAPHKYFYRTWSHRAWTPWTPVTAEIESDHVVLVVWRDRVHLFWVQFIPQAEASTSNIDSDTKAAEFTASEIAGMKPQKKVDVLLYWSALLQGEWSDPVLAQPDTPLTKTVDDEFQARRVFMWADVLSNGDVAISLLNEGVDQSFRIRSPYAPPDQSTSTRSKRVPLSPPYLTGNNEQPLDRAGGRGRWHGESPRLAVHVHGHTIVNGKLMPCDITQDILAKAPTNYHIVLIPPPAKKFTINFKGSPELAANQPSNRPEDPFFLLDRDHTFYVEPEWFQTTISQGHQAVIAQTPVWHEFDRVEFWRDRDLTPAFPTRLDQGLQGTSLVEKHPDVITRPEAVVILGGQPIGPDGRLVVNPGDLVRTGPHGSLIRTDALLSELRAGFGDDRTNPR